MSGLIIAALVCFSVAFIGLAVVALVSKGGPMGQRVHVRLKGGVRQIKEYELGEALAVEEKRKKAVKERHKQVVRRKAFSEIPVFQDRLRGQPWAEKMQARLRQANLPLSLTSFMFLSVGSGVVGGIVAILMAGVTPFIPAAFAVFAIAPLLYVNVAVGKRVKKFGTQFPDALDLLSSSVKSGLALNSAILNVAQEMPEPVCDEFQILSDELSLGVDISDALRRLSQRVNTPDVQFFCTALMIQKETGGNLSEVLDGLQKTIRERFRILRQVKTLTAQGRLSGWILGALPFALAGIIGFSNWNYMRVLVETPEGHKLLIAAGILQIIGVALIRKIVNVKV